MGSPVTYLVRSPGCTAVREDSYIPEGISSDSADSETIPVLIRNAHKNDLRRSFLLIIITWRIVLLHILKGRSRTSFFICLGQAVYSFIVAEREGRVAGFGVAKPFLPFVTFSRVSAVSLYIHHDPLRQGIGKKRPEFMTGVVKARGAPGLLLNISSKNEEGQIFHQDPGFVGCGRFHATGMKNGELFDMVWLEKQLDEQG